MLADPPLAVADFVLGKAYGLGRAMAETALLPDHTAYAVSRGLHDSQLWVAGDRVAGDWAGARAAIGVQGRIWRELLTGEKAAKDMLSLSDYLAAGGRGAIEMIRRFWWVIAATVILTAGVIYAGSDLHAIPELVRVVGSLAWLAGAAGVFAKGVSVVRRSRPPDGRRSGN